MCKSNLIPLALLITGLPHLAIADDYDGDYRFQWQTAELTVEICVEGPDDGLCGTLQTQVPLDEGVPSEEAVQGLADELAQQWLAALDFDGQNLPQAKVDAIIHQIYQALSSELGQAYAALPDGMNLRQGERYPESLVVTLEGGAFGSLMTAGTLDLDMGDFTVMDLIQGTLSGDSTELGDASLDLPIGITQSQADYSVTIFGELRSFASLERPF